MPLSLSYSGFGLCDSLRAERNCLPGRRATAPDEARVCQIRAVERLLASRGSPASKRSWVRTSLLLWTVGAAPAGRVLCHAPERQGRRIRRSLSSPRLARPDARNQRIGGVGSPPLVGAVRAPSRASLLAQSTRRRSRRPAHPSVAKHASAQAGSDGLRVLAPGRRGG
jgi:hypothetical protein